MRLADGAAGRSPPESLADRSVEGPEFPPPCERGRRLGPERQLNERGLEMVELRRTHGEDPGGSPHLAASTSRGGNTSF